MAGHCLVTLGATHTHNHNHIQRSRLRIRQFELQFGCRTVVCTSSSASRVAMGRWGQSAHTKEMTGHCLVTLGATHTLHAHNHNHIQRSRLRIRRFELRFGCRTVVVTASSASRVTMGHWGKCFHTAGMAGHCVVTLEGHTNTTTTTFGAPDHRI